MNTRPTNQKLAVHEIRAIRNQLAFTSKDEVGYALELAIQFNEDLFATIVGTITPRIGHEAMQSMIIDAVTNGNAGDHTTNHIRPIFVQVRKLAGLYLDRQNYIEFCEECVEEYR